MLRVRDWTNSQVGVLRFPKNWGTIFASLLDVGFASISDSVTWGCFLRWFIPTSLMKHCIFNLHNLIYYFQIISTSTGEPAPSRRRPGRREDLWSSAPRSCLPAIGGQRDVGASLGGVEVRALGKKQPHDDGILYIFWSRVNFGNSLVEVDVGALNLLLGKVRMDVGRSHLGRVRRRWRRVVKRNGPGNKISCTLCKSKRQFWVLCRLVKYCYSPWIVFQAGARLENLHMLDCISTDTPQRF